MDAGFPEPKQQQVYELVRAGQNAQALEMITSSRVPYQVWREWIDQMVSEEVDPGARSAYRHLMAGLLFARGRESRNIDPISDAKAILREDMKDSDTLPIWREAARQKTRALQEEFGYQPRFEPGLAGRRDDSDHMHALRSAADAAVLVTIDEEQEMDLIKRSFGSDARIFPKEPSGEEIEVEWSDLAGAARSPLLEAAKDGKPFIIRPSARLSEAALDGMLNLFGMGSSTSSKPGFCLVIMTADHHLVDSVSSRVHRIYDFWDWPERAMPASLLTDRDQRLASNG